MGNNFYKSLVFLPPDPSTYTRSYPRKVIFIDIPGTQKSIPAYYLPARKKGVKTTVLYSHGNAADIGAMNDFLTLLQENLPVNILHYDYIGYGLARGEGETTEENVYQAIEAGLNWLLNKKGRDMEDVIAFGTSVGSGPTVHLATKYRRLRGLVLECPFTSCIRVVMNNALVSVLRPVDMFVNITKIHKIKCPLILFHGMKDTVVPFAHSLEIWKKVPKNRQFKSVWVKNADHHDIIEVLTPKVYIQHLFEFLQYCAKDIEERKSNEKEFDDLRRQESGPNFVKKDPTAKPTEDDEESEEEETYERDGEFYDIYKYV